MNDSAMDHERAVKSMMAERYLLGELNAAEREAYEKHLFNCDACFEQVKTGTEFVGHLSRIGTEEAVPAFVPGFISRLASNFRHPAALAVLAMFAFATGIAIHENTVIARLKAPRPELRSVLTGIAHGSDSIKLIEVTRNSELSLNVEYARKAELISYQARMLSSSGKTIHTVTLPESEIGTMASISMPAEALEPGQYSIVVLGRATDGSQQEVGRGMFELRFTDK